MALYTYSEIEQMGRLFALEQEAKRLNNQPYISLVPTNSLDYAYPNFFSSTGLTPVQIYPDETINPNPLYHPFSGPLFNTVGNYADGLYSPTASYQTTIGLNPVGMTPMGTFTLNNITIPYDTMETDAAGQEEITAPEKLDDIPSSDEEIIEEDEESLSSVDDKFESDDNDISSTDILTTDEDNEITIEELKNDDDDEQITDTNNKIFTALSSKSSSTNEQIATVQPISESSYRPKIINFPQVDISADQNANLIANTQSDSQNPLTELIQESIPLSTAAIGMQALQPVTPIGAEYKPVSIPDETLALNNESTPVQTQPNAQETTQSAHDLAAQEENLKKLQAAENNKRSNMMVRAAEWVQQNVFDLIGDNFPIGFIGTGIKMIGNILTGVFKVIGHLFDGNFSSALFSGLSWVKDTAIIGGIAFGAYSLGKATKLWGNKKSPEQSQPMPLNTSSTSVAESSGDIAKTISSSVKQAVTNSTGTSSAIAAAAQNVQTIDTVDPSQLIANALTQGNIK